MTSAGWRQQGGNRGVWEREGRAGVRRCVRGRRFSGVHVSGARFSVVWAGLLALGRVGEGEGVQGVQESGGCGPGGVGLMGGGAWHQSPAMHKRKKMER
jgi:hypothetical protein